MTTIGLTRPFGHFLLYLRLNYYRPRSILVTTTVTAHDIIKIPFSVTCLVLLYRKTPFLVSGTAIEYYFFTWILYLILFAFLKLNFLRNLIPGINDEKVLL